MAVTKEWIRKASQRTLQDLLPHMGDTTADRIREELARRIKESKPSESISPQIRADSSYVFLTLDLPVSVNDLYVPIIRKKKNGSLYATIVLSNNGRKWKKYAKREAEKVWIFPILRGPVAVKVVALMPDQKRRDTSNLTKALYDAVEGVCYQNDTQIVDEHISKVVDVERGGKVLFGIKALQQQGEE